METQQQELSADTALGKFSLKSSNLNTLATIATLVVVVLLGYAQWLHTQDSRSASDAFVVALKEQTIAIKEQTSAIRENNCLQAKVDAETCRRLR